ncbi:MAG: alkaline phosphatase family protein [Candidatus Eisenbacteria sp.]|nr:alkaline phosphatase family protein [Candidatus Eisenbacteria bacterium]
MVGCLAGYVMATRTVAMNVIGLSSDGFLLGVYFVLIYGLVGLGVGLLFGLLFSLAALLGRPARAQSVFAASLGAVLGLYVFLSGMRLYNTDLYFYDYSFIHSYRGMQLFFAARSVMILAIAAAGAWSIFRLGCRAPKRVVLGLVIVVAGGGLFLNIANREPPRTTATHLPVVERDSSIPKIVLIGWDGATWSVMDRLLAAGRMPNTRQLIERGASGNLKTPSHTVSADIWTRIYTGKSKSRHGIYGFDYYVVPGLKRPVVPPWRGLGISRILRFCLHRSWIDVLIANRTLGRVTPIWQIMNDAGRSAGVIGPLVSWPASQTEPFLISSTTGDIALKVRRGEIDRGSFLSAELFHPPDLEEGVCELLLQEARWREAVGPYLYRKYRPDFFTIYFEEPDRTQHFRWKWMEPQYYSGVTKADLSRYGGSIEGEYVRADSLLGKFLRIAGDSTTVMVLSDHGFSPAYRGGPQQAGHYGGPDGILIAAGPAIRPGLRVTGAHVHDITPTLLALAGMPVARDMDGRVIEEIIRPEFLEEHPVQTTATYETRASIMPVRQSAAEKELYDKLRALGYVGG